MLLDVDRVDSQTSILGSRAVYLLTSVTRIQAQLAGLVKGNVAVCRTWTPKIFVHGARRVDLSGDFLFAEPCHRVRSRPLHVPLPACAKEVNAGSALLGRYWAHCGDPFGYERALV